MVFDRRLLSLSESGGGTAWFTCLATQRNRKRRLRDCRTDWYSRHYLMSNTSVLCFESGGDGRFTDWLNSFKIYCDEATKPSLLVRCCSLVHMWGIRRTCYIPATHLPLLSILLYLREGPKHPMEKLKWRHQKSLNWPYMAHGCSDY